MDDQRTVGLSVTMVDSKVYCLDLLTVDLRTVDLVSQMVGSKGDRLDLLTVYLRPADLASQMVGPKGYHLDLWKVVPNAVESVVKISPPLMADCLGSRTAHRIAVYLVVWYVHSRATRLDLLLGDLMAFWMVIQYFRWKDVY